MSILQTRKFYFYGRLAQLARALGLHPSCRGFESLIAHHIYIVLVIMNISCIKHKDLVQLCMEGHLDAATSVEADSELTRMIDEGQIKLLIDLTKLDYISSAGLRVLLVAAKQLQQKNGQIVLCSMTVGVKEVFEISGFSSIFKIFPTVSEALEFMQL